MKARSKRLTSTNPHRPFRCRRPSPTPHHRYQQTLIIPRPDTPSPLPQTPRKHPPTYQRTLNTPAQARPPHQLRTLDHIRRRQIRIYNQLALRPAVGAAELRRELIRLSCLISSHPYWAEHGWSVAGRVELFRAAESGPDGVRAARSRDYPVIGQGPPGARPGYSGHAPTYHLTAGRPGRSGPSPPGRPGRAAP